MKKKYKIAIIALLAALITLLLYYVSGNDIVVIFIVPIMLTCIASAYYWLVWLWTIWKGEKDRTFLSKAMLLTGSSIALVIFLTIAPSFFLDLLDGY
jgi:hypothetical protein